MNPDQYPDLKQNQYFPIQNTSNRNYDLNIDEKVQSDHNLVQKLPENYVHFTQNPPKHVQQNQREYQPILPNLDQNSQNYPVYPPNNLQRNPEPTLQRQPNQQAYKPQGQVIIYKQMSNTQNELKNFNPSSKLSVIIEGGNDKDSILYGQSVPCQRCGLVSNGNLSLQKGRTVCAWASCLFLTTGLFCFLPCVMDSCKDTLITCARCGHKKAVVKSKMCC